MSNLLQIKTSAEQMQIVISEIETEPFYYC